MTKRYRDPFVPTVFGKGYLGDSYRVVPARSPVYRSWKGMLERCFDRKLKLKYPTYADTYCCEDWLHLTEFKIWFDQNYIENYELDKDILVKDNKVYSPETCCFVPPALNKLLTKSNKSRGKYPIGVQFHVRVRKFTSQVNDGNGKLVHLGYFEDEESTFLAYKNAKELIIKKKSLEYFQDGKLSENVYNALLNYEVNKYD